MIVGRQDELAMLESALGDARDSRARRIAVVGEPGIGKTTLLEGLSRAASDLTVLTARGVESEAELPFGALLDLLRPLVGFIDGLAEPQARALRCALGLEGGAAGDRFAVGAGTLALLAAAAERSPVLVLVDDLHWADAPSREAILFAARRLDADAVAVVVALRDDGSIGERELVGFERLVVPGLGLDAAASIVGETRAQAALDLTGGNPLALTHIGADADLDLVPTPVPLPRRLAEAYAKQLEGLDDRSLSALLVAAVDDTGAAAMVARALTLGQLTLDDLRPAEDAHLVVLTGVAVEFTHPLVRSAVYHAASPAERRAAHAALADAYALSADEIREAWHRAAAALGPDERAAAALERLGSAAQTRAAYATAARAFERAAALSPSDGDAARRLSAAAAASWSAGRASEAAALARSAFEKADDPRLRGASAALWGKIATSIGSDPAEICDVLEREADALAPVDPELASLILAQAADRAFFGGADVERSSRLAERAYDLVVDEARRHPRVMQVKAWHLIRGGDTDAGLELMQRAVEATLATSGDDPAALFDCVYMETWAGDLLAATVVNERAEHAARARADVGQLPEILGCLAELRMRCGGDWRSGVAVLSDSIRLARETGQELTAAYLLGSYAELSAYQGDAERVCAAVAELAPYRSIRVWCDLAVVHAEAHLALAEGDFERALAPFPPSSAVFDTWWGFTTERIEALVHLQRVDEAQAAIAAATPIMTMPLSRARLDRCRGLIAPGGAYAEPLARSIATFAELGADFERARSELYLGERLRRAGSRVEAREHLRVALAVFERAEARLWTERARRELAASGERRRRVEGIDDELTPQERQIARLAAEGRTNREVATLVFLSPKTVEAHLGRAYRKLGISSRSELPAKLESVKLGGTG